MKLPMLYLLGFFMVFVLGGLTGLLSQALAATCSSLGNNSWLLTPVRDVTMTTGMETATRSSTAANMKDWVPPPEALVEAIRARQDSSPSLIAVRVASWGPEPPAEDWLEGRLAAAAAAADALGPGD